MSDEAVKPALAGSGTDSSREAEVPPRRRFVTLSSRLAMLAGLLGGYGGFSAVAGRFLYPARPRRVQWMYVARVRDLKQGGSLRFQTPGGSSINITRQGSGGAAADFIALSSVCPHLGCHVHWEAAHERYFCPCHNGTFNASGVGTGGPPGDAGMVLSGYPLKVEKGSLFLEAPVAELVQGDAVEGNGHGRSEGRVVAAAARRGPGHDPCLENRTAAPFRAGDSKISGGEA